MRTNSTFERWSRTAIAGWLGLLILATVVGVFSLRYALPKIPLPEGLPNFKVRHHWLIAHAVCSSLALLAGPWQFIPLMRRRWLRIHRWLGHFYCLCVAVGWIASVPIAAHAAFGIVPSTGFLSLGFAWIICTTLGYITARRRHFVSHRKWMIRSYALTAAAITLRIYLIAFQAAGLNFPTTYRLAAWACWIPNLIFAELLIRYTASLPDTSLSQAQPA